MCETNRIANNVPKTRMTIRTEVSRAAMNLKGILISGRVELEGEEARNINRLIHLRYVIPEALNDPSVASYLSKGDDITAKVHMDRLISWNLADSKVGKF